MILELSIVILSVLTMINMIFGVTGFYAEYSTGYSYEIYVNGSSTVISQQYQTASLTFDLTSSMIALGITAMSIVALYGVKALGSGLDSFAVKVLTTVSVYLVIWAMLSYLASGIITNIPVFGLAIYGAISMMFFIGLIQKALNMRNEGGDVG
ncbi:hypothetical protein [Muninn virus]|nr:hypothetical protein [Muninn virus]